MTRRDFIKGVCAAVIAAKMPMGAFEGVRVITPTRPAYMTATDVLRRRREMNELWLSSVEKIMHSEQVIMEAIGETLLNPPPDTKWFSLSLKEDV